MAEQAKVSEIDVLRDVKAALAKFAEEAGAVISGVDAEVARMGQWLSHDRPSFWKAEIRRREDKVQAAKAAISRKQLSRAPEPASVVEERRELQRCQHHLEDARARAEAVRRWAPVWDREALLYKSSCAGLSETLLRDIPAAMARLERMAAALHAYVHARDVEIAGEAPAPPAEGEPDTDPLAKYRRLRESVPSAADRPLLTSERPPMLRWTAGTLKEEDASALRRLAVAGPPPSPDDRIVLAWRAVEQSGVVFARLANPAPGDSGWIVLPLDRPDATAGLRAMSVGQFVEQVPSLAAILELRPGSLLVLTGGTVRMVLDEGDRSVWDGPEL
jgi:hypothetical protein